MNLLSLVADGYERKARLYPGLILVLPPVVTIVAIWSANLSSLQSLSTVLVGCGGAFLLAQLTRDAGKKQEEALFASWGGIPSVAIFRHRDDRVDTITKSRYHKRLATLLKGAKPPSAQDEAADPAAADRVYHAWSTFLRISTRDAKKYPLLFKENVNYGYRRNLYGLRAWGIAIDGMSCAIAALWCAKTHLAGHNIPAELGLATLITVAFLLLWVLRFTPAWVRVPADAYAERLAETVEMLKATTAATKK